MVRMGELVAARGDGDQLVSLGLGSCIGLALLDRRLGIAGLAHIVLPDSAGHRDVSQLKFADRAVPELITRVIALGGRRPMLEAALVGGASMFTNAGQALEVGQRNALAVHALLASERIRVVATAIGGSRGRTIRVFPGTGVIAVREARGVDVQLHPAQNIPLIRQSLQEVA